jgi:hypothetical protein
MQHRKKKFSKRLFNLFFSFLFLAFLYKTMAISKRSNNKKTDNDDEPSQPVTWFEKMNQALDNLSENRTR